MGKIRDITFDIAKGIGIVLVVIGHYIFPITLLRGISDL